VLSTPLGLRLLFDLLVATTSLCEQRDIHCHSFRNVLVARSERGYSKVSIATPQRMARGKGAQHGRQISEEKYQKTEKRQIRRTERRREDVLALTQHYPRPWTASCEGLSFGGAGFWCQGSAKISVQF
jgi:hypothetical protein